MEPLRILFVSQYYPPEIGAPAGRVSEMARAWSREHDVTVLTTYPNHPHGRLYPGYEMDGVRGEQDGNVRVVRVPVYLAANRGIAKRGFAFLSFCRSAVRHHRTAGPADLVIGTSPQLLVALAAWRIAARRKVPFVMEVRDLWPESIVAVGALKPGLLVWLLERLEMFLYRRAARVVTVTDAIRDRLVARGIPAAKILVHKNGIEPTRFLDADGSAVRAGRGWENRVVAMYAGTLGMAHGIGQVLDAAALLQAEAPEVRIALVGAGAEEHALRAGAAERGLANVEFVGMIGREEVPRHLAAADILLVVLRAADLFKGVIPSKLFEAMAAARPIVLAVEGESRSLLERAAAGVAVPPDHPAELARAIADLAKDPARRTTCGENGRAFVLEHFDRTRIAAAYGADLASLVHA